MSIEADPFERALAGDPVINKKIARCNNKEGWDKIHDSAQGEVRLIHKGLADADYPVGSIIFFDYFIEGEPNKIKRCQTRVMRVENVVPGQDTRKFYVYVNYVARSDTERKPTIIEVRQHERNKKKDEQA